MFTVEQIQHWIEKSEGLVGKIAVRLRKRLMLERNSHRVIWELVLLKTLAERFVLIDPEKRVDSCAPDFVVRDRLVARGIPQLQFSLDAAFVNAPRADAREEAQVFNDEKAGAQDIAESGTESPAMASSTDVAQHPVYLEIENKLRQICGWPKNLQNYPIILAIYIAGYDPELSEHSDVEDNTVNRAVFAALSDHEGVADLISTVLIVWMSQGPDPSGTSPRSKVEAKVLQNKRAQHPLDEDLLLAIRQLDFNTIDLGAGFEESHDAAEVSPKTRH
jgi:hypothetical protein